MSAVPNTPATFLPHFRWPAAESHKYTRGHAIVAGGPIASTGAARIAALNALRTGAGLVSIACDREALPIYAASCLAVMTKPIASDNDFHTLLADPHVTALLIGPGAGIGEATQARTLAILAEHKPVVLDADALTSFAGAPEQLLAAIQSPCIITPHEGEFSRLFWNDVDSALPREARALQAAKLSNSIVVLKGHETLIASPDGRVSVNRDATPFLATAGAGDALAGICLGLLAQSIPAYEAACAAVWLHTQAANLIGPGLIAEDIATLLPNVLSVLYHQHEH
jgi:hydroxyethylthiazole kinase-like uncharacterized protein yjeF